MTYIKMGAIALLAAILFGAGFYFGGLKGGEKAAVAVAAKEGQGEAIETAVNTGLEQQLAHSDAQAINDNTAEKAHAKDIQQIDTAPADTDPLFVQSGGAASSPICRPAVPGPQTVAAAVGAGAATGGAEQSSGNGDNRRPEIEALKAKLERIAADERLLVASWPK